jgi:hypothetical protein
LLFFSLSIPLASSILQFCFDILGAACLLFTAYIYCVKRDEQEFIEEVLRFQQQRPEVVAYYPVRLPLFLSSAPPAA